VKLSLVIPVYNETPTLREIIQRVVAVDFDKELVLVDDGSTDGSRELLGEVRDQGLSRWLRDPAAARGLFEEFATTSLGDPSPPTWAYLLLQTHPTLAQRVAMTDAWQARRRSRALSP